VSLNGAVVNKLLRWHFTAPGVLRFYLGRRLSGDLWWFGCEVGYEDLFLPRVSLEDLR
jgi:hypothetical protein